MSLKFTFFGALLCLLNTSCGQNQIDNQENQISTVIPNNISTTITDAHQRIYGTKVFSILPNDFNYIKELSRFQYDEKTHIMFVEMSSPSFIEQKHFFTKESFANSGSPVDVLQKMKVNKMDGIYVESKNNNQGQIALFFGDESTFVTLMAVYDVNSDQSRQKIWDIIETVYYNEKIEIDPLELANFSFELNYTGFELQSAATNNFTYTLDGISPGLAKDFTSMSFSVLPAMTISNGKNYCLSLIDGFSNVGSLVVDTNETEIRIDNTDRVNYICNVITEGKKGVIYVSAIFGLKETIIFLGVAHEDVEKYKVAYEKTLVSLKLK